MKQIKTRINTHILVFFKRPLPFDHIGFLVNYAIIISSCERHALTINETWYLIVWPSDISITRDIRELMVVVSLGPKNHERFDAMNHGTPVEKAMIRRIWWGLDGSQAEMIQALNSARHGCKIVYIGSKGIILWWFFDIHCWIMKVIAIAIDMEWIFKLMVVGMMNMIFMNIVRYIWSRWKITW